MVSGSSDLSGFFVVKRSLRGFESSLTWRSWLVFVSGEFGCGSVYTVINLFKLRCPLSSGTPFSAKALRTATIKSRATLLSISSFSAIHSFILLCTPAGSCPVKGT